MTFTENEPMSNQGANQESNQIRTLIELAFKECDRSQGRYTAVAIAGMVKVSDTAVRKAFKALKQVVSEGHLANGSKYTEFCKTLMTQYFQRPPEMNGAEWIYELQSVVGALPEAVVSGPVQSTDSYWKQRRSELNNQSSALATRSQSMLARIRQENDFEEFGDDEAFEAELQATEELAYERELRRQVAIINGRNKARQDIRQTV